MDVFRFVHRSDPYRAPRLGARLDAATIVDLQAAHFSMRARPSPWLRDVGSYVTGGEEARRIGSEVVAWVATQRPPGTIASIAAVDVLDPGQLP